MVQDERDLRLIAGEMHDVLFALAFAIKAEDKESIDECLVRVERISEFVEFISKWRGERKKQGFPA